MGIFVMTQRRIYQEEYPYFVTFRIQEGFGLFDDVKYAELMARIIIKTCTIKGYDVLAWQIMPDHVHLLTYNKKHQAHPAEGALHSKMGSAGTAARARRRCFTVSDIMHGIKSYYCDQIRDQYGVDYPIFQKRFYSRIVNNHKYLRTVIEYIKHNPIKAELSRKYQKLPYQYFDWDRINALF
jgi:REP element-mobilizing transposase RayT